MFASRSLTEHLFRGALGIGALIASVLLAPRSPIASLALVPVALVAFRGCPLCWTLGLAQTVLATLRGRTHSGRCVDGGCVRAIGRNATATSPAAES